MDKIIIGIAYFLVIFLFYKLIMVRIKNEKSAPDIIYILIVLILLLLVIWSIFRNI